MMVDTRIGCSSSSRVGAMGRRAITATNPLFLYVCVMKIRSQKSNVVCRLYVCSFVSKELASGSSSSIQNGSWIFLVERRKKAFSGLLPFFVFCFGLCHDIILYVEPNNFDRNQWKRKDRNTKSILFAKDYIIIGIYIIPKLACWLTQPVDWHCFLSLWDALL